MRLKKEITRGQEESLTKKLMFTTNSNAGRILRGRYIEEKK